LEEFFSAMDSVLLEEEATKNLNAIILNTEEVRQRLETSLNEVTVEGAAVAEILEKLDEMGRMSKRLKIGSLAIMKLWKTRNADVWGPDALSAAIETQIEEAAITMSCVAEPKALLEPEVKPLKDMKRLLQTAINRKTNSLQVDQTALATEPQEGPSNWEKAAKVKAKSKVKHKDWEKQNAEVINKCTALVKQTGKVRATVMEAEKQRIDVQRKNIMDLFETSDAKAKEWVKILGELPPNINAAKAKIAELESYLAKIPGKRDTLQHSVGRAEERITTRNTRPKQERKVDEAEEALLAEVKKFKGLLDNLAAAEAEVQAELKTEKATLARLELEQECAVACRDIDCECWKQQEALYDSLRDSLGPIMVFPAAPYK